MPRAATSPDGNNVRVGSRPKAVLQCEIASSSLSTHVVGGREKISQDSVDRQVNKPSIGSTLLIRKLLDLRRDHGVNEERPTGNTVHSPEEPKSDHLRVGNRGQHVESASNKECAPGMRDM